MAGFRVCAPVTASVIAGLFAASLYAPPAAYGADRIFPKTKLEASEPYAPDEPVLLSATDMEYDQENQIITASGQVEITQGSTTLICDELIYDQQNNRVEARGNISIMDENGHVLFADEAQLSKDMSAGIIEQFKARLADDSLFVAARAERVNEQMLELDKAVYSPCKVKCAEDGSSEAPMWQLKTSHVKIDEEAQKVTYDGATMEVYGMPVFYTPYLSHATPGADNKSGLLAPEFKQSSTLGPTVKLPVYYSIAPDYDATIIPIFTSKEGVVMAGEYRQLLDNGSYAFNGSITNPKDRNDLGAETSGNQLRGHINGEGHFAFDENYDWGFDLHRTTDDTYMRRYGFGSDTLLTSRAYAEGFNFVGNSDRNYTQIQTISFQGLTQQDDSDRIPVILPMMDFNYETLPGAYNSRFSFDANLLSLTRNTGTDSKRLSATTGWRLPYITPDGQVIEFAAKLRSDIYSVQDVLLANGDSFDGTTGRLVPEATLDWRYPFLNQFSESSNLMIEPVIAFAISPGGGNPETIPNEDSLVPEFTDTNLFSDNRYPGLDRIESGPRMSYGLRGQAQFFSDKYVDWLIGQHYRINNDRSFPFSNDLGSAFSDYVGKIGFHYLPVDLAYRFRLDKDDLSAKRQEVDANYNLYPLSISGSYLSLQNDPVLSTKEEISGTASLNLTREWSWSLSGRRDLELNQLTSIGSGISFKNECTSITTLLGKEYTRDRDIKPATTFLFQIAFKNLE